jgi:hypothetical protein
MLQGLVAPCVLMRNNGLAKFLVRWQELATERGISSATRFRMR